MLLRTETGPNHTDRTTGTVQVRAGGREKPRQVDHQGTRRRRGPTNAGEWWRRSVADAARTARRRRLRLIAWLTRPAETFRYWLATPPVNETERRRWNERIFAAAQQDPNLAELDDSQQRAACCFEDRTIVTAGAGSGKPERWSRKRPTQSSVWAQTRRKSPSSPSPARQPPRSGAGPKTGCPASPSERSTSSRGRCYRTPAPARSR